MCAVANYNSQYRMFRYLPHVEILLFMLFIYILKIYVLYTNHFENSIFMIIQN